ncbi:hypothetical protein OAB47_05220 [Vicingaceae bacterium]|nr:hypothetical protein [Vicingaceae bacterium]
MNIELENLINMALADGVVTEKEREIILRKAESLGIDKDEIEMILDGKLHQLEASKPKQKEKVGNVKTCPACGATVKSFTTKCLDCGHEYRATKGVSSIITLTEKIGTIDPNILNYNDVIEGIISNFPIPNNKEDLLEFIAVGISKAGGFEASIKKTWADKADEAINKLEIISINDLTFKPHVDNYRKMLRKKKIKSNMNMFFLLLGVAAFVALAYFLTT